MNEMNSEVFNYDLQIVKALTIGFEKETIVTGYYCCNHNPKDKREYIPYIKPKDEDRFYEINPYTVCRNSGIKDENGNYAFEYDLLKIRLNSSEEGHGFIIWSEFYKKWIIKRSTEFSGYLDVDKCKFVIVGNIILDDDDAEIMYKQDESEKDRKVYIDTSDCRSTQHKNKIQQGHLPLYMKK